MLPKDGTDSVVYVVDDDPEVRDGLKQLLESVGLTCVLFNSTAEFWQNKQVGAASCLILDVRLPGTGGLDFQRKLVEAHINIPIIFITGHGDIPMTVQAMKRGAVEFLTKPLREQDVLDAVSAALERDRVMRGQVKELQSLQSRLETLSDREREMMTFVVAGLLNKQIAARTSLTEATVKVHRHNLMKKLGATSVPELVRMADILGIIPAPRRSPLEN
jgi:FixJ family two-component response regulator